MKPYYVSFSPSQAAAAAANGVPGVDPDGLVLVWAPTEMDARTTTIRTFGQLWCGLYSLVDLVDNDMARHFRAGVTVTIGTPVEVVYVDEKAGGARQSVAYFENSGIADQFVRHIVEHIGYVVQMNGPSPDGVQRALHPLSGASTE